MTDHDESNAYWSRIMGTKQPPPIIYVQLQNDEDDGDDPYGDMTTLELLQHMAPLPPPKSSCVAKGRHKPTSSTKITMYWADKKSDSEGSMFSSTLALLSGTMTNVMSNLSRFPKGYYGRTTSDLHSLGILLPPAHEV